MALVYPLNPIAETATGREPTRAILKSVVTLWFMQKSLVQPESKPRRHGKPGYLQPPSYRRQMSVPNDLTMENHMRTALLVTALLLSSAPAVAADPVEGEWLTPNHGSKVRIGPCGGNASQICGVVSWLPPAQAHDLDIHNPDASLRSRPILGAPTITGFTQSAPGKWTGGKLYNPASGKTYSGKISANPDGTLKVQGCVMMICDAETWTRN